MKIVRSVAKFTDYSYYGRPQQVTRLDLFVDQDVPPEQVEVAKQLQDEALRHVPVTCNGQTPGMTPEELLQREIESLAHSSFTVRSVDSGRYNQKEKS